MPAIAASTCSETLMSLPCSSHVYQVTPTPASCAASSRRSPGVRRRPVAGSPACSGAMRSRLLRRKDDNSRRLTC